MISDDTPGTVPLPPEPPPLDVVEEAIVPIERVSGWLG